MKARRALQTVTLALLLGLPAAPAPPAGAQEARRHTWLRQYYGTVEGSEGLLYNASTFYGKLAFGDLDGDSAPDLLVGTAHGRISLFRNRGTRTVPDWRLTAEALEVVRTEGSGASARLVRAVLDVGEHAAPALVDIDGDGDLDLFVGTADGRLLFYRNAGNPAIFLPTLETEDFVGRGFGTHLIPAFADVDRDRSPDLFLGNREGRVYLLVNRGDRQQARFCVQFPGPSALPEDPLPCAPTPRVVATIAPESFAAPALVDWDGDGDPDLFVGKRDGTIAYYPNRGTAFAGDWFLRQTRFLAIDNGGYAAPAFFDVNGDGRPDLFVGNSTGRVSLYTNKDTGQVLDVWRVTDNYLQIRRLGPDVARLVVTSGDLDGDGDLDLIVGDRSGALLVFANDGTPQQPHWRRLPGSVLPGMSRQNTAPLLVDLDGDGDLDLLVGGRDGRLWLVRNEGTPQAARWHLESTFFAGIDVGSNAVPVAADLDGDKDWDLLVGNSQGLVIHFRNQGSATGPDFTLASTRFANLQVPQSAVPALFDWNGDGKPDLVVGSREGTLTLVANENEAGDPSQRAWRVESRAWLDIRVGGYSAPHFADLNGDKRPDLLVGDGEGNLLLWYNGGAMSAPAAPAMAGNALPPPAASPPVPAPAAPAPPGAPPPPAPAAPAPGTRAAAEPPPANVVPLGPSAPQPLGPLPPVFRLASEKYGDLAFEGRTVPAFGDIDGDGDLDLVVGTGKGLLVHLRNDGTPAEAKWTEVTDRLGGYDGGRNPSPILADLNGNGRPDLLVGTENGELLLYENTGVAGEARFVLRPNAFPGIRVSRYAAPAVGDVTGDGVPDLLIGDFRGNLTAFAGSPGEPWVAFKLHARRFAGVDAGVSATPFLGDLDRDGQTDLLIGSDQGNLLNFKQIPPNVKNAGSWEKDTRWLAGLKFPPGTTPRLADIDGDGDQDLVVGTEKGTLYLYRNEANAQGGAP